MKVLLALDTVYHFAYHESVIRSLCARGHQVHLITDPLNPTVCTDRAARAFAATTANLHIADLRRCRGWRRGVLFRTREVLNYTSYFTRDNQSSFYRDRWHNRVMRPVRVLARFELGRRFLTGPAVQRGLRRLEDSLAADPGICQWLRDLAPDVVVASPANVVNSEEIEYIKAANALGIPTAVAVLTWDNLTTKGLLHVAPRTVFAWNRCHAQEATEIHGIPSERVVIVGSQLFDKWFEAPRLLTGREAFCRRVGLDPSRPFLAYLGSSRAIAQDESWLVRDLLEEFGRQENPALKGMQILIRPHPANAKIYEPLAAGGVPVWPPKGQLPDSAEAIGDYYNTLVHCVAAVGVNTTGMLDSVIVDKPTVTILAEQYLKTQTQAMHFTQLRAADVLELTHGAKECVQRIGSILGGGDAKHALRRQFVESFIRPRGLDRPAGEVLAEAIVMLAAGADGTAINARLDER